MTIELCLTHNEGKFVVAERLVRTSKNKIYKYMTTETKNMNINKLDKIVDKYNKIYHGAIKVIAADIHTRTYIEYGIEHNGKDLNSKSVTM